ncbi:ArsR/SmtB family transcription factor [Nonomuraea sp. KM90]|uniref:ArsR/SmtB family transcription factor n=1 Tax=Nonomuraea sp. KM90 TaxID=3457428 RepID=UPI003FCD7F7D
MVNDDLVFKALADPTRRHLLDRLFERDGRTLTELESEVEMTRFGVMKHLRLLEEAGLIIARKSGREKLHFLNPVPIRLLHDRWIDKYTERRASALTDLKSELEGRIMTGTTSTAQTVQVYQVYIKATPQAIWDAITKPEWTRKYGYGGAVEYDLRPGGTYRGLANEGMIAQGAPEVAVDGEVVEADPPHKLVQTWRVLMDPAMAAEGFTRLTYEIAAGPGGVTKLTVTHDLSGAPLTAALLAGEMESQGAGGGWNWMLSGLKTLLETGEALDR